MGIELYVRIETHSANKSVLLDNPKPEYKTGYLELEHDNIFRGFLEKDYATEIFAELGSMNVGLPNEKKFLHLLERKGPGDRFNVYWLGEVGNSHKGEESVYFGHFNEENLPNFAIHNIKTTFMESPRFKNGTAHVLLSQIGYN